jgi:hypothetical protein
MDTTTSPPRETVAATPRVSSLPNVLAPSAL